MIVALGDGDLMTVQVAKEKGAFGVLAFDSDYFFFPDMAGVKIFSNKKQASPANIFQRPQKAPTCTYM